MMRPLTAEQAEFWLQNIMLGMLKNESRTTRSVLESVPADKADHRPDPASRTALELVRHIAIAEKRFVETPIKGVFDMTATSLPDGVKTPSEIAAWYADSFAQNFEKLTHLKGEQLAKTIDFRGMFQMPAAGFLQLGLNHSIHHRGQLCSYLRCMGAKVPAIYGESFDSAQAKQAAQSAR
jgi:uncharacterized damage-inducible protein DinB